jgi:hypothetical protein
MKSKLTLLFVISVLSVYGQPYERLVDTTKLWSNLIQFDPPDYSLYFRYTWFSGDSLVDNIHYKKVYVATDSLMLNCSLEALVYEDSTGKVYIKYQDPSERKLIYDFNVKLGDTVYVWNNTAPMLVDLVDSVIMGNKTRKRIHLAYCMSPGETWIEGIGSELGVLSGYLVGWFDIYSRLQCYLKNDSLLYHNNTPTLFSNLIIPGCYYTYTGIGTINLPDREISVFPNPLSSTSHIKIQNSSSEYLVKVYSMSGNLIKSLNIPPNGEAILSKSDFAPGIYQILASSTYKLFVTKLVVL